MPSNRERDDNYGKVVAQLGPDRRVIVCADDFQWIIQRKIGAQWRGQHYCTSREGVIRRTKGLPGWEALTSLPDRFKASAPDTRPRAEREVEPSGHTPAQEPENAPGELAPAPV
jgi:hypothetical protein